MSTFRPVDIVRAYCDKYRTAPSKTLARRILKDHPRLYSSVNHCMWAVRRVFGVAGERSRKNKSTEARALMRQKRKADWAISEGLTHHNEWGPYILDGVSRLGVLSDIHAPYHHKKALTTAIKACVADRCDAIVLNGDICDFYASSRFQTDPRKRDLLAEVASVVDILSNIRKALPKARIVFKKGNHEERWFKYLCTAAPDLLDMKELSLEALFHLKDLKIEMVTDRRQIIAGDYNIIHGHELGNMYNHPVGPARAYWMRTMCNTIVGHLHRTHNHSEISPVTRQVQRVASAGCLCDLEPDYAPMNKWNHGFVRLDVAKSGKTTVQNLEIDE